MPIKILLFLSLALMPLRAAETDNSGAGPMPRTEEEKTLYTLGYELARNIVGFELRPEDIVLVVQGVKDSVQRKKSLTDIDVYGPKIRSLEAARREAKMVQSKARARDFISAAAKAKGAVLTKEGLVFLSLKDGDGRAPSATDTVLTRYRGYREDGSAFDETHAEVPVKFTLNRVVPCWTVGLQRMRVGGKARLTCPSSLTFGDNGEATAKIERGSALVFEFELTDVLRE